MKNWILIGLILGCTALQAQDKYGKTGPQVRILNMDCLHDRGFTGKGVTIAHFDDGFDKIYKSRAFEYARKNGLLKGEYDFVFDKEDIDEDGVGTHGLETTSVTHGYISGQFVGTAYDANILLAHTEDNRSEKHVEEHNWRKAVDWAVENGADIITSSLQYNEFDEGEYNYSYKDLNGRTTIITKAAEYAADLGVLVVTLQGNFGDSDWHWLAAPGDAFSVITVGAVDGQGKKAPFSGYGPTIDGRIKPDVLAVGWNTTIYKKNNTVSTSNGTSYAAPAIAGLAACLLQAHPERTNLEIISAIRQSADRYADPDITEGYGYGIPDACKADDLLTEIDNLVAQNKWVTAETSDLRCKSNDKSLDIKPSFGKRKVKEYVVCDSREQVLYSFNRKTKSIDFSDYKEGHYLLKAIRKKGAPVVANVYVNYLR